MCCVGVFSVDLFLCLCWQTRDWKRGLCWLVELLVIKFSYHWLQNSFFSIKHSNYTYHFALVNLRAQLSLFSFTFTQIFNVIFRKQLLLIFIPQELSWNRCHRDSKKINQITFLCFQKQILCVIFHLYTKRISKLSKRKINDQLENYFSVL